MHDDGDDGIRMEELPLEVVAMQALQGDYPDDLGGRHHAMWHNRAELAWNLMMGSSLAHIVSYALSALYVGVDNVVSMSSGSPFDQLMVYGGAGLVGYANLVRRPTPGGQGICEDGIYGAVRNPVYLGFRLFALGYVLTNPTVATIATGALVFLTTELTARMEEKELEARLGDGYMEYRERVAAWIPHGNQMRESIIDTYYLAKAYVKDFLRATSC